MSLHAIFEESVQRWKIRQNQLARTWVKHHIDLKLIAQQGSYLVLARALREHIMPPPPPVFREYLKKRRRTAPPNFGFLRTTQEYT